MLCSFKLCHTAVNHYSFPSTDEKSSSCCLLSVPGKKWPWREAWSGGGWLVWVGRSIEAYLYHLSSLLIDSYFLWNAIYVIPDVEIAEYCLYGHRIPKRLQGVHSVWGEDIDSFLSVEHLWRYSHHRVADLTKSFEVQTRGPSK